MTKFVIPSVIITFMFFMAGVVAIGLRLTNDKPQPSDGAALAKVCRDGTFIWHYRDGTYHASGWHFNAVEDINTVCAK